MQKNSLKYPVEFVDDLFGENDVLAQLVGERKVLLVADHNVVQRNANLGTRIGAYVKAHGLALTGAPVVIAGGERVKLDGFRSAMQVVDASLRAGLGSEDFVLAIGGGTLLDVAGWAAAQTRGGVRIIRVPTTPAAMMGAAFSETASLDTVFVKDALRVASTPAAVFIGLSFAATVLDGVWRAGASEAVRLAAAKDPKLLAKFQPLAEAYNRRDAAALETFVRETVKCRMKKGGTELGLAAAAGLEPKSGWKLPPGYAVSIGIIIEMLAAMKEGTYDEKTFTAARAVLKTCGALDGLFHSRHILPPEVADFW